MYGGGIRDASGAVGRGQSALQEMRMADANLRAEAQRIASGSSGTTTVSYSYTTGPDGRNYLSSVTVTQTKRTNESGSQPFNPSQLSDLAPASTSVSPLALAAAETENRDDSSQQLAEQLATLELQQADAGVRAHEGLHFRAAGGLAVGLPQFDYVKGPDGVYYAVGGQVDVQTTATSDPDKAARDAATFATAATAPGDASAQDMSAARGAYGRAADTYASAMQADARKVPSTTNLFA